MGFFSRFFGGEGNTEAARQAKLNAATDSVLEEIGQIAKIRPDMGDLSKEAPVDRFRVQEVLHSLQDQGLDITSKKTQRIAAEELTKTGLQEHTETSRSYDAATGGEAEERNLRDETRRKETEAAYHAAAMEQLKADSAAAKKAKEDAEKKAA